VTGRREPRPIAEAVMRVAEQVAPATTIARVQGCWDSVAGVAVAEEAQPVSARDGVVTIACRSAVWANELELLSNDLVGRLNEALERPLVTSLRFVVGRSGGPP
jgi:predicted nucleic acid-binding Zn ribbon protein